MAIAYPKQVLVKNADGYDDVAARCKPSATNLWDMPSGSIVDLVDEWTECEFRKKRGFIKTKNLPGALGKAPGSVLEVLDSYKGNKETCMRRHPEQDNTKGNVLCYVPNGSKEVTMVDCWVECKWRGIRAFVKARHVQHSLVGVEAVVAAGGDSGASSSSTFSPPPMRGAPVAASGEPPAKKAKTDDAPVPADPAEAKTEASVSASATPAVALGPSEKTDSKVGADPVEASTAAAPVAAVPTPAAAPVAAVEVAAAAAAGVAAVAPAPAAEGDMRDCDCCFDSLPKTSGVLCPGKGHFFCSACLVNFLQAFKTAEYCEQKKGKGRALCPMKDSDAPFSDGALVSFVPQDVFDEYLQIRIKVAEQGIQEQIEKENRDKIEELKVKLAAAEGGAEQMELDKHRLRVIDDIFTLKCPRCKMAFLDYDNCSAVSCAGCKCGFCSFCLEDCGADAHQHFYKHKSKCPKEGGGLFLDHKKWQEFQTIRKSRLLREYLATVPEAIRQKVADLIAPDAKDLGLAMPMDVSSDGLKGSPQWFKLKVPRKLRGKLAMKSKTLLKKDVELVMPHRDAKVPVVALKGFSVVAKGTPVKTGKAMRRLPNQSEVSILDEWVSCACAAEKIPHGWVKNKHVVGRPQASTKRQVLDAGGHGAVLIRRSATQEEDENVAGWVADSAWVKIVDHWIECKWEGAPGVPAFDRGFVQACDVPEDDVYIQGPPADCRASVEKVEEELAIEVFAEATLEPPPYVLKGRGRGRGKGAGRGRG
eukprot:TRINITY_DN30479_c0_g1_i1.p1 TRINITY_DN30479_c0_g1~~TRINITY_DN30479_c0_g1_i1.p1  ORF type:complete len:759 (-),score=162.55 TRINITY_DN30479_c0_g1_i1:69-2345(-)